MIHHGTNMWMLRKKHPCNYDNLRTALRLNQMVEHNAAVRLCVARMQNRVRLRSKWVEWIDTNLASYKNTSTRELFERCRVNCIGPVDYQEDLDEWNALVEERKRIMLMEDYR